MTVYLDEIQARADAATAAAPTPAGWVAVWSDDLDRYTIYTDDDAFKDVCVITPDVPQVAHFIAHARTDIPRLVAALREVEALCDAGDEAAANATRAYPEGEPDPGPPPAWVWADDIRTAIRDALYPKPLACACIGPPPGHKKCPCAEKHSWE